MKEEVSNYSAAMLRPGDVVLTAKQSKFLLEHDYRIILKMLWYESLSVRQLSERLGELDSTIFYRCQRLERAGILVQDGLVRSGRGRPKRLLKVAFKRLILPFYDAPLTSLEDLLLGQLKTEQSLSLTYMMHHVMRERFSNESALILEPKDGFAVMDVYFSKKREGVAKSLADWGPLQLDPNDIEAVHKEIEALLQSYTERANPERLRTVHCGIQFVLEP